jgi:hypothetical protein
MTSNELVNRRKEGKAHPHPHAGEPNFQAIENNGSNHLGRKIINSSWSIQTTLAANPKKPKAELGQPFSNALFIFIHI